MTSGQLRKAMDLYAAHVPVSCIACKVGVPYTTLRKAMEAYPEEFPGHKVRRRATPKERARAVRIADALGLEEAARATGWSEASIRTWRKDPKRWLR